MMAKSAGGGVPGEIADLNTRVSKLEEVLRKIAGVLPPKPFMKPPRERMAASEPSAEEVLTTVRELLEGVGL